MDETVYAYVVASIYLEDGKFIQIGSAPNFQGGLITLCTCKRWMRTFRTPENWKRTWIAGLCSLKGAGDQQALFYLMRVEEACESHRDLWAAIKNATSSKNAHTHRLDDLYEPRGDTNPCDPNSYYRPVKNHSHRDRRRPDEWHDDINYTGINKRRAALLVGAADRSYLWDQPRLICPRVVGRAQKKFESLGKFLAQFSIAKPSR